MERKTYPQRNFRPWPENHKTLTDADRAGLNVSELLNEVIARHLPKHMVRKGARIAKAGAR